MRLSDSKLSGHLHCMAPAYMSIKSQHTRLTPPNLQQSNPHHHHRHHHRVLVPHSRFGSLLTSDVG